MKSNKITALLGAAALVISLCPAPAQAAAVTVQPKYLYSGASHSKYTNEALYAAPIVTDLDNNGTPEIVSISSAITVTDAASGQIKWRVNSGKDRSSAYETEQHGNLGASWCNGIVQDIDKDGWKEIVSVHLNCISVLDPSGYFKPGWPKNVPIEGSLRSVAVDDLNGDGKDEIIVGAGVGSETSVWVYDCSGNVMPGWPQLSGAALDQAESYGVFANGIATGDIDGDNLPEIMVPTDNACIQAYNVDGSLVMANAEAFGNSSWGSIRAYVDYNHEKTVASRGWDDMPSASQPLNERLCAEFGHAGTTFTDVDNDGKKELVVTGIVIDKANISNAWWLSSEYMTAYIFNGDRTRYTNAAKGFDWTAPPTGLGGQLKHSTDSVASFVFSEPVAADLDGDGAKEILFNSYDDKLYCFTLDKKQRAYTLPATTSTVAEYATEPVCKDINGDGKLEVIFASWTDGLTQATTDAVSENTGVNGSIYILDSNMNLISRTQLPQTYPGYEGSNAQTNGSRAAPAVEDIDGDGQYEIILNTTYRSVCVYDIVGSTTQDTPFADLTGHWSKDSVMNCVKKGYLSGTSATSFSPNGTLTRAMAASVLYRIEGQPAISPSSKYTDIDTSQWYANAMLWAMDKKLLSADGDKCNPNSNITREELAVMMYQCKGSPASQGTSLSAYTDAASISSWAADAMKYCVSAKILQGGDGKLNPSGSATRAEFAVMLTRYTAN